MKTKSEEASARLAAERAPYNPDLMVERVKKLLEKFNESYREAGLRAGLDHQTVRRILEGHRPSVPTCILLANHFGVNPNEFLDLASWPTMEIFDVKSLRDESLPPEAIEVARSIAKIPDPGTRKKVTEAILTLIEKYFEN